MEDGDDESEEENLFDDDDDGEEISTARLVVTGLVMAMILMGTCFLTSRA